MFDGAKWGAPANGSVYREQLAVINHPR